eukprot:359306-Chlamydomonas_euryale.AAC.6
MQMRTCPRPPSFPPHRATWARTGSPGTAAASARPCCERPQTTTGSPATGYMLGKGTASSAARTARAWR